jgi:hypothetical protein
MPKDKPSKSLKLYNILDDEDAYREPISKKELIERVYNVRYDKLTKTQKAWYKGKISSLVGTVRKTYNENFYFKDGFVVWIKGKEDTFNGNLIKKGYENRITGNRKRQFEMMQRALAIQWSPPEMEEFEHFSYMINKMVAKKKK